MSQTNNPAAPKMMGQDALGNGNDHFGVHERNNFCPQRGCEPVLPTPSDKTQPPRWMILPYNSAYPNFNEAHREDEWCKKAGCLPVSDECIKAGKVATPSSSSVREPQDEIAREPHDGWMNAWMFENIPRDQNCAYLWNPEARKFAGDWADAREKFKARLSGEASGGQAAAPFDAFKALPLPDCDCGHSGYQLVSGLHTKDCAKLKINERNCRVTHPYFKAGYELARAEARAQREWNPLVESIRSVLMREFSDHCSMEQISEAAYLLGNPLIREAHTVPDEQEQFEAMVIANPGTKALDKPLEKVLPGIYANPFVQACWEGWQFRATIEREAQSETTEPGYVTEYRKAKAECHCSSNVQICSNCNDVVRLAPKVAEYFTARASTGTQKEKNNG